MQRKIMLFKNKHEDIFMYNTKVRQVMYVMMRYYDEVYK